MKWKNTIEFELTKTTLKNKLNELEETKVKKYHSQIFNIISNTGQATRPKYVGQMSEIIPKFIENYSAKNNKIPGWLEWKKYYLKNYKKEYDKGYKKLIEYVEKYRNAFFEIINDEKNENAKLWYDNFILKQNFMGFAYEGLISPWVNEIFFKKMKKSKTNYEFRKSTPEEESENIDFLIKNNLNKKKLLFNVKPNTFNHGEKERWINDDIILLKYKEKEKKIILIIEEEDYKKIEQF